ncbi:MAG: type II restriction endonuclease [Bacteroidaceae bacterium]|nr:type II restriction endonuclease [Bacteroidaceae bacterium]
MFLDKNPEQLSEVFISNLLPTNRGFNYYVDWSNIAGYKDLMVEIHAIDVLIGITNEESFRERFNKLLQRLPTTISLFPLLFGLAKAERKSLKNSKNTLLIIQDEIDSNDHLEYAFALQSNTLTKEQIDYYYDFFVNIGLKELYQNIIEKSTLDYVIGVLVGLDSNGRKNRGGMAFELACQPIFEKVCRKYGLSLLIQKKFKILRTKGFEISKDIENRKADFIVFNEHQRKAINFEVNFYNGTGSKPEEIIDSYINRQSDLIKLGLEFSLVTDGRCWQKASNQLNKGFRHLHYLENFYMFKHGMLEEIVKKVFNIQHCND